MIHSDLSGRHRERQEYFKFVFPPQLVKEPLFSPNENRGSFIRCMPGSLPAAGHFLRLFRLVGAMWSPVRADMPRHKARFPPGYPNSTAALLIGSFGSQQSAPDSSQMREPQQS